MSRTAAAVVLATLLAAGMAACATTPPGPGAPQPLKTINAAEHYNGTWLEIGRRPMKITDGCVAGFSTYALGKKPGQVDVLDGCYMGAPGGKLKTIKGKGRIIDPGTNAKMRVRYLGVIVWEYWVLDKADDGSWFISADPTLRDLYIYTRKVPTPAQREALTRRAAALGYDVSKLEFPAH